MMTDPVVVADGHSYDRDNIQAWFSQGKRTSPLTNARLPNTDLLPNRALRGAIRAWRKAYMGLEE
jgi:sacsin